MKKKFKIQSSKLKVQGFTLVELLVSSAIFITIGTIIVTILSISFRVSQRTELTLMLKNNGSNALSQMVNSIKYAKSLDDPTSCVDPIVQSEITFTSAFDGGQTRLSCPTGTVDAIASNGAALLNIGIISVKSCSFTCSQVTANDPPTITIQFELAAQNSGGSADSFIISPFQTAVTMRNFTR